MDPNWVDAHFCSLHSQSNVYALTKILMSDGPNKLLVAPIRGQVIAMEYQRVQEKLTPSSKAIQFTYIPGDAEIVSLDAFAKTQDGAGLTVGITFLKVQQNESRPLKQFLNIYSFWQQGYEFNLDSTAPGCVSLELNFVPYQLTHTELICDGGKEVVFLLSGTDHMVHMYKEDRLQNTFVEYPVFEHFPEFRDLPSSVLWMDILYLSLTKRLTAHGHECGFVSVSLVDVPSRTVDETWTVQLDSPITTVKFFSLETSIVCPTFVDSDTLSAGSRSPDDENSEDFKPQVNLLVTSALEAAAVYRDVLANGLSSFLILPDSNKFDSVMCASAMDVDFDGQNEIILGTYGQELLVYKFHQAETEDSSLPEGFSHEEGCNKLRHRSSESKTVSAVEPVAAQRRARSQEDLTPKSRRNQDIHSIVKTEKGSLPCLCESEPNAQGANQYKLLWKRSFAYPVLALDYADIMGDGLDDLAVVTLKGLHILQPDLDKVSKLCLQRLRNIVDTSEDTDDDYKILQSENLTVEDG